MRNKGFLIILLLPVLAICIAAADGGAFEDRGTAAESFSTDTTAIDSSPLVAAGVDRRPSSATSSTPASKVPSPDVFSSAGGKVVDETTNLPLAGATVTLDGKEVVITDRRGFFPITHRISKIAARAPGYTRAEAIIADESINNPLVEVRLQPFHARALYLTVYGIGSKVIRHKALSLIKEQDLNALVIDIKGDRGFIPYPSDVPLAASIGAQKIKTVGDIKGLIKSLKDDGIYTIARIVVFKDNLLGTSHPELAVKTSGGKVWLDREQLAWVDASRKEVWDYNIQIAIEAAKNGFDEIQFDYVRFPDHNGLKFAIPNTEENRVACITGFLQEAQKRLQPYNVFLAADIFGYVPWNYDDTQIGQRIDKLVPTVDYISLMLYPSGFHLGIPGYLNSVANSYQIVHLTLKKAQERTKLSALHFRPWLQSFRDYAFDRREFTGVEIEEQIKAAEDFGSAGWMLWNPRNVYSPEGIRKKKD